MKAKIVFNKPETEEQYLQYFKHWHLGEAEIEFDSPFDETYWRNEFAKAAMSILLLEVGEKKASIVSAVSWSWHYADAMIEEMRKRNG